ncbi:putative sulfate exporter family transporter [Auritidibacter ignavus]|uniref:YeiH family protein n=1 Tax=Auritidibacter TaxID=1160973 RepID=UPI000D725481|nr:MULTISPECIES: putative sulfate exporter family transporter [Auritidibacter]PXA81227.1 putative sulfate exporter family transporter [Auritidibacter sp. NML120779]AXR74182.1 putative sulfate exporter family transporter [Auritidibacter sp. NML130574]PXA75523.1 putative sulfate exporter family transporter [Auritidibacter sp. NML100628]PXA79947.1 putative sulfate exporter family transporter [Auritidibacter sp. NML120636]WGH80659.1 putative sulfate exporter family transporter [Auritidibacter igna
MNRTILPGLVLSFAIGALALGMIAGIGDYLPGVSGLLVAIVIGVLWRNIAPVPEVVEPGITVASKTVLRWGIVLMGLQLAVDEILALGWGTIVLIVLAVVITFGATVILAKALRVPSALGLLIASGFSICGAAAVAGADSVLKAKKEFTATSIGLVVLFGTLMIPAMPVLVALCGFSTTQGAIWAGTSVHEVAQVVAVAETLGPEASTTAVTVKLGRVMMLAFVLAAIAFLSSRHPSSRSTPEDPAPGSRPALVPWFVIGFFIMVALRSVDILPPTALEVVQLIQSLFLATAMFGLGMGVRIRSLVQVGARPIMLATLSTLIITVIGGLGAGRLA